MNTFFPAPIESRSSWLSPDMKTRTLIDYVLVSEKIKSCVCEAWIEPNCHITSDHRLVICDVVFNVEKRRKFKPTLSINREALHDPQVAAAFTRACNNLSAEVDLNSDDIEYLTGMLQSVVSEAAQHTIPKSDNRPTAR